MRFTSLAHLMDEEFLKAAWQRVRKDGAVGVDQQSAKDYAANLDANLRGLCERLRSGRYKAPPVRRVWIFRLSRWQSIPKRAAEPSLGIVAEPPLAIVPSEQVTVHVPLQLHDRVRDRQAVPYGGADGVFAIERSTAPPEPVVDAFRVLFPERRVGRRAGHARRVRVRAD